MASPETEITTATLVAAAATLTEQDAPTEEKSVDNDAQTDDADWDVKIQGHERTIAKASQAYQEHHQFVMGLDAANLDGKEDMRSSSEMSFRI